MKKEMYRAIVSMKEGSFMMSDQVLLRSLKTLSELLYKQYGQKPVILIDEYDVPLDKAFQCGYYREMAPFIRGLFGDVLKTNDALEFAVLMGCLRVSKESIFTGLNNFKILSITDTRFDEQFGFTDEEVKNLLSYYHVENRLKEVKDWYDGYRFGNVDVYCPWDVINHVDRIRDDPDAGIITELKYTKEFNEMECACQKAIAQIKDRRYHEYLLNDDRHDILLYGIAFCKKRCKVIAERM